MQFGTASKRLVWQITQANPKLGPIQLQKVDLSDAYMRVWLRIKDVPSLAFVVPNLPGKPPLIGFHLSLPMGYIDSTAFFCITTETVTDLANATWHTAHKALHHPLEHLTCTSPALDDDTATGQTWLSSKKTFTALTTSLTPPPSVPACSNMSMSTWTTSWPWYKGGRQTAYRPHATSSAPSIASSAPMMPQTRTAKSPSQSKNSSKATGLGAQSTSSW
eukprot:488951-Ditylum_brightwellii.AAC.1